ncbi:MAG: EAL domain-containing response regulator [Kofleriaceae bacterium]
MLIVEDDALQRRAMTQRLGALGVADVQVAADGLAALEILETCPTIELVITDLAMPGMDGLELLCELGARGQRCAIAVHSALDGELLSCMELMAREKQLRFLGTLAKPATSVELAAILTRAVAPPPAPRSPLPSVTRAELAAGLARGEFVPFFQPKVSFRDRSVAGVEALARWHHPVHGLLPPAAFLDVMEQEALLGELARVIIDTSAQAIVACRADGVELPVAVNLSASFLSTPGMAAGISRLIRRHGVAPELVTFEITEAVAMTDVGTCLENIARLRMRGHRLAIDDFGVGYSSLVQLMRIPAAELKLDRGFVTGIAPGTRAARMLAATIVMAHQLEMATVAEGVETEREWDFLTGLGCDIAQGYLIARPLPLAELRAWLARHQPSTSPSRSGART